MVAVVGLVHVEQEASHGDLVDSQVRVFCVHGQGDESVSLGHLSASLSRDLEAWSVVSGEDGSLDILCNR